MSLRDISNEAHYISQMNTAYRKRERAEILPIDTNKRKSIKVSFSNYIFKMLLGKRGKKNEKH